MVEFSAAVAVMLLLYLKAHPSYSKPGAATYWHCSVHFPAAPGTASLHDTL
jgi:hypothetical protein